MPSVIQKGSTNKSITIRIIDSTTGLPETAVEHNTTGIDLFYRRELAVRVAITEVALAALTTAHADGGIEHISDGYYRLDLPDLAFATGADSVLVGGTVTGMVVIGTEVQLVDYNPEDAVRLGLTALPNAVADAAGGLPISDAGGLDLDAKLAATNEITAVRMAALTDWINGGRLDLILDAIPITAMRGTDGVDTATMRGTDSAALASVATETRLAELDGANLPTDVDAILVDTGTTIPALLPVALVGGRMNADIGAKTGNVPLSAQEKLDVNTEADTALTDYDPPTKAEMDTAHGLLATPAQVATELGTYDGPTKAEMDSAHTLLATPSQVEAAIEDVGIVLQKTTIATLASQVSFTLTAGSADNNAYVGKLAVIEDATTAVQKAVGVISAYVGSTKTITLREDPAIFTMAVADKISILAISPDILDILSDVTGLAGAAMRGTDGVDTAPMRGTDSAALASVATEARLAELDGANIPADLDLVLADTGELQTDWVNGGRLDVILDVIKAITDNLPDSGALNDLATILADTNELQGDWVDAGRLDVILDAIKAVTDLLPNAGALNDLAAILIDTTGLNGSAMRGTDSAALASVATEARLAELDGANLPTDVDAIKTKTDSLPSGPAKNVALANFSVLMVDDTDHVTPELLASVSATISKDGGAFAASTNSVAEVGNGLYKLNITAAEMNADILTLRFTASGADDRLVTILTT